MVRPPHLLSKTKTDNTPTSWIILDTIKESTQTTPDAIEQTLDVGYAQFLLVNGDGSLEMEDDLLFLDMNRFWQWLNSLASFHSAFHIISNDAVVDLIILSAFERFPAAGWKLANFYSRDRTSIFTWKRESKTIKWLDIGNFYPGDPADWENETRISTVAINPLDPYIPTAAEALILNVAIIRKLLTAWLAFLKHHRLGSFKTTVSSTAFNAWRRRFLGERVHIHANEDALTLERDAYHGGRTECLFVGKPPQGEYYYLDVNNMYGHVLERGEYPISIWGIREEASIYQLQYKLERYAVIAEVDLNTSLNFAPHKILYHTAYPLGNFRAVLTTPELKFALDNDLITAVHRIAHYRAANLFSGYARYFRELREHYQDIDNVGMTKIVKLFINGLYGKFGQKDFRQEIIGKCDPKIYRREQVYDLEDGYYYDQVYLGGNIFRETREGEAYHSAPAIAAHVTAYARMYLFYLMKQVPPGHLYYVDTDSLLVDAVGKAALESMIDPSQMGMLKIEYESDWLDIVAPKHYHMQGRDCMSGVRPSANPLGQNRFEQWEWPKLRGLLQMAMSGEYTINRVVKQFESQIWSGYETPTGWVDPYIFSTGEIIGHAPIYSPPAWE